MNAQHWQIPEEYPHFAEKTALICLTHRSAKVYVAAGNRLQEEAPLQTAETDFHYTDKEGLSFARGSGVGTAPGTEPHNEQHYDQVFLNYLAEKLRDSIKREGWKKVLLFLPADMKGLVLKKIPKEFSALFEIYEGNLANAHPLELLKRIAL